MSSSKPQFAILQTDSVLPKFQAEHGNYPGMFTALLGAAGIAADQLVTLDMREAGGSLELPEATAYNGYLITGSRHSVYDDLPWIARTAEFAAAAMAAARPVVGICFGHQLLAHFFGGKVGPASNGWAVGVHQNRVMATLPWMQPGASALAMLSSHKDQVQRLPADAQCIAQTDHCSIAGFTLGKFGLALQSHPEFSAAYASDLINHRAELLGDEIVATGQRSMQCPLDNQTAGHWIARFLMQTLDGGS